MELDADLGEPYPLRLVAEVGAAARELASVSLLGLSVREVGAVLDGVAAAQRALDAAYLGVLRALEGRDLAALGATSISALVSARLRLPPGQARADAAAARATDPDTGTLRAMGTALADGAVSKAHVSVAVSVLDQVPTGLRRECAPVIDEFLTTHAKRYRPRECAHLAREVLDRIDPDRHEQGYDPEAFTRRSFTLRTDAYGMGLPAGQLDPMTAAALKTALDHYAAPTPAQAGPDETIEWRDERTPGQRRCDAIGEIARRALAAAGAGGEGATRAGEPPRIVVHTTAEQLSTGTGTVDCEATGPVPAAFLRRIVCDCVLERVLLAPNGAVLNLGRAVRTATPAQRRALAARDRGCIWPGCTIPARWTDVHHVPGWAHGSRTDVDEMCLLCGPHHQQVEAGHYRIEMRHGVPYVIPPSWMDPQQQPVRNTPPQAGGAPNWHDKAAAAALGEQLRIHLGLEAAPDTASPPTAGGPAPPDTG